MLISFIIPAFNASQTIVRCLDSIYSLVIPETEYEVIVIDDCSNDDTVTVIESYALSHENLTLLRQSENHRQGAARNRGLEIAKGQYILFVDSDDTIDTGVIKALNIAQQLDLDMVAMQYGRVSELGDKSFAKELQYTEGETFSGIEFQKQNKYWCSAPWGYLYKKSFIQTVAYPFAEDVLYEDSDFVMNHLYQAKRMSYCSECAYLFFYNSQSTTHTTSFKHVADYMSLGVRMLSFYQRIESNNMPFARDILEGGVWNVNKACKRIWRLKSWKDVREFYHRIDAKNHREYLRKNVYEPFKLTTNSRMIINHKFFTILTAFMILPISKALRQ